MRCARSPPTTACASGPPMTRCPPACSSAATSAASSWMLLLVRPPRATSRTAPRLPHHLTCSNACHLFSGVVRPRSGTTQVSEGRHGSRCRTATSFQGRCLCMGSGLPSARRQRSLSGFCPKWAHFFLLTKGARVDRCGQDDGCLISGLCAVKGSFAFLVASLTEHVEHSRQSIFTLLLDHLSPCFRCWSSQAWMGVVALSGELLSRRDACLAWAHRLIW